MLKPAHGKSGSWLSPPSPLLDLQQAGAAAKELSEGGGAGDSREHVQFAAAAKRWVPFHWHIQSPAAAAAAVEAAGAQGSPWR